MGTDKLLPKLPWWHRALRPWFEIVAARRAARELKRFHRVGYFLETDRATKILVGVIEASQNGKGQRRLKRLQGFFPVDHYAIPAAWRNGDNSTEVYLHPTPFRQTEIGASQ